MKGTAERFLPMIAWYFIFAAGSRLQLAKGPSLWLCRQNLGRPMAQRSFAGMVVWKCDWFASFFPPWLGRPEEGDSRTHKRLHRANLSVDACIQYRQLPVVDLDSEEPALENWPFIFPMDFAVASTVNFSRFFCLIHFFLRLQCCNDMAMRMFWAKCRTTTGQECVIIWSLYNHMQFLASFLATNAKL